MILLWIFAVVFFIGVLIYSWNFWKSYKAGNDFIENFVNGHHDCSVWRSYGSFSVLLLAAVLLVLLGIIDLFFGRFDGVEIYALILFGLALLSADLALKIYQDQTLIFYSQGFVWQELIFPYKTLSFENSQVIQETPVPLNRKQAEQVEKHYKIWFDHK